VKRGLFKMGEIKIYSYAGGTYLLQSTERNSLSATQFSIIREGLIFNK
jgi:hypothetical protein